MEHEVKFISSLAVAIIDKDGNLRHVQITIAQDIETAEIRCFFDVVDPSKIKLQDEVSKTDSAE